MSSYPEENRMKHLPSTNLQFCTSTCWLKNSINLTLRNTECYQFESCGQIFSCTEKKIGLCILICVVAARSKWEREPSVGEKNISRFYVLHMAVKTPSYRGRTPKRRKTLTRIQGDVRTPRRAAQNRLECSRCARSWTALL